MLPVPIPDQQGNGGAQRLAGTDAAQDLDRIRLDAHPSAAAVARHAARQLAIDVLGDEQETGRDPFEDGHQRPPVRLPCRGEPDHRVTPGFGV